jgi:PAS domain S-box-containing protein
MMLVLAVGLLPLAVGAILVQQHQANAAARGALDRSLSIEAIQEAARIESYFERARSIDVLTAQNPAFKEFYALPGTRASKVRSRRKVLDQVNQALDELQALFPGAIGEACFIDRTGPENARVVRGERALPNDLSPDESKNPFFAPTFALRPRQVYQAKPYVSPDTNEWVISNSTPIVLPDGSKQAIVHFEVTIESFRKTAAGAGRFQIDVVDGSTGAVIFDSRYPQRLGAPLGRPADRSFVSVVERGRKSGYLDLAGRRAAYVHVPRSFGNANNWYIVASSEPVAASLLGIGPLPIVLVIAALLLVAFAVSRRWARIQSNLEARRRRSDEELRRSEGRFRTLVSNLPGAVYRRATDPCRTMEFVSEAIEGITGYPASDFSNGKRGYASVIHADDRGDVEAALRDAFEQRRPFALDYRIVHADQSLRWVHEKGQFVHGHGASTWLDGAIFDISDRRRAEEALQQSNEQLRQAQKMEAVGRLAGGIAHDFNNLLTAITGHSEFALEQLGEPGALGEEMGEIQSAFEICEQRLLTLARNQPEDSALDSTVHDLTNLLCAIRGHSELLLERATRLGTVRTDVEEVRAAADRAAALTRQLLSFSRRRVLETTFVDLSAVVGGLELMLRRMIGEDIELVAQLDPEVERVKADPGQIEQVIMNLVVNARDAMPRGGTLTIETELVDLEGLSSGDGNLPPGRYVLLAVSDTGTGMDAETRSHLFEPFFTTKGLGKGTGLGLATVYGIVKQTGGDISVVSAPGEGATFNIYLPVVEAVGPPRSEPYADSNGRRGRSRGTETILLVEDEGMIRELVHRLLVDAGYTVLDARDAGQALELWKQESDSIDLVLTDVVMPDVGGPELVQRLAAERPDVKVLYMSGYTDQAVASRGLLDTGYAFLQKPFAPSALARKVREVLDGQPAELGFAAAASSPGSGGSPAP